MCHCTYIVPTNTANLVMLLYTDSTFTIVHQDEINTFHEHLNEQNPDMYSLLKRLKEMERFLFLDCLVICDNNKLQTTVDRKWTHTDRLLDQSSCNPTLHKAITIKILTRGVQLVCDSPDSLSDKTKHLECILQKKKKQL